MGLHDSRELKTNPNFSALLVTGIASPGMLYAFLKKNFKALDHLPFDDHHEFTDGDAEKIKAAFLRLPGANKIIITTEKDAMRMALPGFKGLPIYYLPVEVGFLEREQEFNDLITKYIQTNTF